MKWYLLAALALTQLAPSLSAKQIVVGVDFIPQRTVALVFTPLVLTDPISAKFALEYRMHPKFNLVFPVEAKWMDYRAAIKLASKILSLPSNAPEHWYRDGAMVKPGYNIDYSHMKLSGGLGIKYFPFSESMSNAFYIKTIAMAGVERFNAFGAEGQKDGAVFTHALTIGYNWVKGNVFTFGLEAGEEYSIHTNPIAKLPRPFLGFAPLLQFSLGFNI